MKVAMLTGDAPEAAAAVAGRLGLDEHRAALRPEGQIEALKEFAQQGAHPAMVGDGINDAPAMAHAGVSLSPGSAADAAQTTADFVFQGDALSAVLEARKMALGAKRHILQNFAFAALYNVVAAPLAMAGIVTPLIAALAMSGSSLVVTLNALRLASGKGKKA